MLRAPRSDAVRAAPTPAGPRRSILALAPVMVLAVALLASCGGPIGGTSGAPSQQATAPGGTGVSPSPGGTSGATVTATTAGSPTVTPHPTPSPTAHLPFTLTSSGFASGAAIPTRYTCSGADVSPPLSWSHAPAGTAAFALLVVDTDAAGFVHWVAVDIRGDLTALAAGTPVGIQGRNSFGRVGYGGPCPPVGSGPHHYAFTLYALSRRLALSGVPTAAAVRAGAAPVTLATARLTGTFRR